MATVKWNRFAHVEVLKDARPEWLKKLFEPHEAFFKSRGVVFDGTSDFDYGKLASVLAAPDDEMDDKLIEALFFIHEMSKPEDMDRILEENGKRPVGEQISFDFLSGPPPMEVAIQAWLSAHEFLEEKHAEQNLAARRSFESFPSFASVSLARIDSAAVDRIRNDVDDWLAKMKRERNCRIYSLKNPDGIWFMIRHGLPFRRERSIKKGKSGAVYFQPEHFDVVVYDQTSGDLRVNAENAKAVELYRRSFGLHLFGSEDHFKKADKYMLDPLFDKGEDSLACSDIPGLEKITLREVTYSYGGDQHEVTVRKADDLFAAYKAREEELPKGGRHTSARFDVKYADVKATRSFTIRLPRGTKFTRDEDGLLLYNWMLKRGFIVETIEDDEIIPEEDMATASV